VNFGDVFYFISYENAGLLKVYDIWYEFIQNIEETAVNFNLSVLLVRMHFVDMF
jgi:hypothetical protein